MLREEKLALLNEYINVEEGLKRVMNSKAIYKKLLTSYKGSTLDGQLLEEADKDDFEAAAKSAHAIKGVAANLSFIKLYQTVTELETLFKNNQKSDELLEEFKEVSSTTMEFALYMLETL